MTTLELITNDQCLIAVVTPKLASGDVNSVKLHVNFDITWDGFHAKSATFYTSNDATVHEQLLTDNECTVPPEVLGSVGVLFVGVRGITTDGKKIKTSSIVKYKIIQGATSAERTLYPTKDMYQQYLATLNEKFSPYLDEYKALLNDYATILYVDNKVADLVESVPGILETLQALSDALGDDPNFATTISNMIGEMEKTHTEDIDSIDGRLDGIEQNLATKLDKTGGTLSDNLVINKPEMPTIKLSSPKGMSNIQRYAFGGVENGVLIRDFADNTDTLSSLSIRLNHSEALKDNLAQMLMLELDSKSGSKQTFNIAHSGNIKKLVQDLIDIPQISVGTYTGSGLYGQDFQNNLTFDFVPKLVMIFPPAPSLATGYRQFLPVVFTFEGNEAMYEIEEERYAILNVTLTDKTVKWYATTKGKKRTTSTDIDTGETTHKWVEYTLGNNTRIEAQLNISTGRYTYMAIG